MGQAFDATGRVLGETFGETQREVLNKLIEAYPSAAELRIKTVGPSPPSTSAEMPKYRCHKDVWALKIRDITIPMQPGNESDGSRLIHPAETGYGAFRVNHEYVRKHNPQVGGYYVVYKDGYQSFSPADAFEEGYTRL